MALRLGTLTITSVDFDHSGALARRHGAAHDNVAPSLSISGVPEGTVELALIVHDPDAPLPQGFTHWVLYGISLEATTINHSTAAQLRHGPQDAGGSDYFGPKPPAGHGVHHYYFTLYALDTAVQGEPSRDEFLARYSGNILEIARIVGTYETLS